MSHGWVGWVAPAWRTEHVLAERELAPEVVFLHDPRRAEAAAGEIVLNVVLLEHHFFQNFGERVAAGVGGVFLLLGDGERVRVEEMADGAIAADQDELAEGFAGAGFFEEPEEAFDGDVDYFIGRFLAGSAMNDVGDAGHGAADDIAVGNIACDDFETITGNQRAIVAESAKADIAEVVMIEDATNEIGANFAGRAGDENAFHEAFLFEVARRV